MTRLFLLTAFSTAIGSMVQGQNVGIRTLTPASALHIKTGDVISNTKYGYLLLGDPESVNTGFSSTSIQSRIAEYTSTLVLQPLGSGIHIGPPTPESPSTTVFIPVGTNVGLDDQNSGFIMMGRANNYNIVLDNRQIQGRNNGAPSLLYLQANGGNITLGPTGANHFNMIGAVLEARVGGLATDLVLQPSGKIRLGGSVDAASTKLHIATGNDAGLTEAASGYMMMGYSTGANMVMDNNEIIARTNGVPSTLFLQNEGGTVTVGGGNYGATVKLGINGDAVFTGNVRVGTTPLAAGYNFGVDGKIICEELQVKLKGDWADYVFDPAYKLRSIGQVADFVKENNHLPGIPAASVIAKNGISIGEMQKMQMEKIEELTLYIIQLKEEVELLKKR